MSEEVTVTVPAPATPPPPPSTDHSLAITLGEVKAQQAAQHDLLMEIMHRLDVGGGRPADHPPAEVESRLERLEAQNESEIEQPPPVSEIILPPPEHHEPPPGDPITPELTPPVQEKRFLGMLHAW